MQAEKPFSWTAFPGITPGPQTGGGQMEFYHSNELATKFDLKLDDLWDYVKTGKLQPFRKRKGFNYYGNDPISGNDLYVPIFPGEFQYKYDELQLIRYLISSSEQFSSRSNEEHWSAYQDSCRLNGNLPGKKEDYLKHVDKYKKLLQTKNLNEDKKKADALEEEFKDLPLLYYKFSQMDDNDQGRRIFEIHLRDAYFLRDQIEEFINNKNKLKDQNKKINFHANNQSISHNVIDAIKDVSSEVENIYETVKTGDGGVNNLGDKYDNLRLQDVLNYCEDQEYFKNTNSFLLNEKDLTDEKIYHLVSAEKTDRQIIGKILKRYIMRIGLGKWAADKLFSEYKKQTN